MARPHVTGDNVSPFPGDNNCRRASLRLSAVWTRLQAWLIYTGDIIAVSGDNLSPRTATNCHQCGRGL